MLNNIKIQNYRNLKSLRIENLGNVNLIIGKNNTGKTSLLEAISIFLYEGNINWLTQLLEERGDSSSRANDSKGNLPNNLKAFSGHFWNRNISFDLEDRIFIEGDLKSNSRQIDIFKGLLFEDFLSIRFVKFIRNIVSEEGARLPKTQIIDEDSDDFVSETGIEITSNNTNRVYSLESDRFFRNVTINRSQYGSLEENVQFVRTNNILRETNGSLWDNISLTDKEKYVEDALRIIEKRIERFSFIGENQTSRSQRIPVVRLRNNKTVIPLRSMGDGINRILTIILAMVNCEDGYLLIDEFENGLHYSVQEKLWEIIFHLAARLNIQVFVTTHSNDTIRAFENIVNRNEFTPLNGLLIKLENFNDIIEATTFEPNELKIITDNLIEVRR